jgi:hypothetical protein
MIVRQRCTASAQQFDAPAIRVLADLTFAVGLIHAANNAAKIYSVKPKPLIPQQNTTH